MNIDYQWKDKVLIINLHGHVDLYVSEKIEKEINNLISSESKSHVILNLRDVDYVSSAGLGVFITLTGKLKKKKRKFVLCNIDDDVMKIFAVLKLTEVFNISDTEENALKFINEES